MQIQLFFLDDKTRILMQGNRKSKVAWDIRCHLKKHLISVILFWGGWGDVHADNSFGDQRAEDERSRDKMVDIRKMSKSLC